MKKLFLLCSLCLCLFWSFLSLKKEGKEVILLLDWCASPNHVPLFAGVKKGFFKSRGIRLKIIHMQDPVNSLSYLATGNVDIALSYMPSSLRALERDPRFSLIGVLIDKPLYSILVRNDKSLSDLDVAYSGDKLAKAAFEENKERGLLIREGKICTLDPYMIFSLDLAPAMWGYWNIEKFQLEEKGIFTNAILWEDLQLPVYPELVFVANKDFIAKNRGLKKAFQEAIQESIEYTKNCPEEAFTCYQEEIGSKQAWEKKAFNATRPLFALSQEIDFEKLAKLKTWMQKRGLLKDI